MCCFEYGDIKANFSPGYRVVQVRLIFRLWFHNTSHPLHRIPLAYVQWFTRPDSTAEDHILMFKVARMMGGDNRPKGSIVLLHALARFVQLIPCFGPQVAPELTQQNSMDRCKWYYINSFTDKEIYQSVY